MCGITGYVGRGGSLERIRSGLKNLEYRGYDSVGIALRNGALEIYKDAGTIDDLELPTDSASVCGIGHTRWSTHGEPTRENAHPHTDCVGEIAVVHNGIVENYDDLREELAADHEFTSETDTEVVPHLIEDELASGEEISLVDAVEATIERLDGAYAIGVTSLASGDIVAARNDSPLVLGHADDGHFLASDVTAFLEYTDRVTYLEDGDVARLTPDDEADEDDGSGITITNGGSEVERPVQTIEWEAEAAEKGGYDHYMLKEIHEQPTALRQALSGRVTESGRDVDLDLDLAAEYVRSLEELQLVACGTSYHASLYAKHLIEAYADVRVTVHVASEYEFGGGRDPWRTLAVAITQSGETADTLSAIRRASREGAHTLAITNTLGSTVTRAVEDALFIRAGPEISVAATKTFVSQVATAALFAVYLGRLRGELSTGDASEVLDGLQELPGAVQRILDDEDALRGAAASVTNGDAFYYLGRKLGHPVSLEGALKLKEISYDHAEAFPAGELKHGPLALVTENTPVIATMTEGTNPEATVNNVKQAASRGALVIGMLSDEEYAKYCDEAFVVSELGVLEPLLANVAMQLFAYFVADSRGRPIDKPRHLAKSVTVE